jgi:hypothetical protein
MNVKNISPVKTITETIENKTFLIADYRMPSNHEGGWRLMDGEKPLRLSSGTTGGDLIGFQPFPESDPIWDIKGAGIPADGRFLYPDRNVWGVVYENGGKIWNMKNEPNQIREFDKNSDIVVNVNDVKGQYKDNTGNISIQIYVQSSVIMK